MINKNNHLNLDQFLLFALQEDIGTGDVTTDCCVPKDAISKGFFKAKEPGIICGLDIAERVFQLLDPQVKITQKVKDGDSVNTGDIIAEIEGPSRSILTGERTALNIMQHMSAVATRTAQAVRTIQGTNAKIVDTRKILPGFRVLDKYAVRCGGGFNHRFNLSDGVLIKDNHIAAAGGIQNAITLAKENCPQTLKIEVEAESLEQVKQAVAAGADIIMLDNMTPEQMAEAVKLISGRARTEASGNMGERDLKAVAETGVDFISIGALTHSVKALDISLKFK
ncbi:MAG: carboxylating nicotinate-nucleotide diphosphorylase [Oscillospiraceae bacterium]|nr:carboxylating nicotinate-nucleotide diphosphorylase [Oscillospiraceae bacterium]